MITEIKMRRDKIASGLTFSGDPEVIASWAKSFPRVLVYGETQPPMFAGVRFVQTKTKPIVKNLLGTYLYQIPGNEVLILANPDVLATGKHEGLLSYVTSQKMELAWAAHCDLDGKPMAFIMTAAVVGHLMKDMPERMTFEDAWLKFTAEWMVKMLPPHRYFDATPYSVIAPLVNPVLNAYSVQNEPISGEADDNIQPSLVMPVKRAKPGRPKKSS